MFDVPFRHHLVLLADMYSIYEDIPDTKLGGYMPSAKVDKLIREKIEKVPNKDLLLRIFFNRMNFFQTRSAKFHTQAIEQLEKIEQLQKQIQELQAQIEELKK